MMCQDIGFKIEYVKCLCAVACYTKEEKEADSLGMISGVFSSIQAG